MVSTSQEGERFYGWTALAGTMLVHFSGSGCIYYSYGVFLPSLIETFGWSRSALSAPYSLWMIIAGLSGPLIGISLAKFGAKKNIIVGNLIAVLGLMGMSLTRNIWHVYLFFSILGGIGNAFGTLIATMSVANNWFVKKRALAMSLIFTARGVGGLVLPPVIAWLIANLGWRLAWVNVGVIHLVSAVIIGGRLIRNKPEDMGQLPDGGITQVAQERVPNRVYQTPVDWKTGDALRTPALWMILAFSTATMFTLSILSTHQVAYIQELGFAPMTATATLGSVVGISIAGRLAIGFLNNRFEGRHLAAVCLTVLAIGIVILMNIKSLPFIYLYAVMTGLGIGGLLVLRPTLIGAYYGRTYYAQILGWTAPVSALIGSAGPLFAGFIYAYTGSYILAFIIAVALLGVGLVCALLARPPKPRITIPSND